MFFEVYLICPTAEFELKTENPLDATNEIEISGIYGRSNYDITLLTNNEENINLANIELFSNNEKISLIKIEI